MIPKWLPDPNDESAYPGPDDLNLNGWAWEFLRRNESYQRAYDDVVVECRPIFGSHSSLIDPDSEEFPGSEEFVRFLVGGLERQFGFKVSGSLLVSAVFRLYKCNPSHPAYTNSESRDRRLHRSFDHLTTELMDHWWSSRNRVTFLERPRDRFIWDRKGHSRAAITHREDEVYVRVLIGRDIPRQLAAIAADLMEEQEQRGIDPLRKRRRTTLYPAYLRVLDGAARGIPLKRLDEFMPQKKPNFTDPKGARAQKALETARNLTRDGYRDIPFAELSLIPSGTARK